MHDVMHCVLHHVTDLCYVLQALLDPGAVMHHGLHYGMHYGMQHVLYHGL